MLNRITKISLHFTKPLRFFKPIIRKGRNIPYNSTDHTKGGKESSAMG
jgi:hypothetical protein